MDLKNLNSANGPSEVWILNDVPINFESRSPRKTATVLEKKNSQLFATELLYYSAVHSAEETGCFLGKQRGTHEHSLHLPAPLQQSLRGSRNRISALVAAKAFV